MADAVRRDLATPVARHWPRTGAPVLALAALLVSATVAVLVGPANIAVADVVRVLLNHLPYGTDYTVEASVDAIVWEIRVPRVLLAGAVGASLAFSGAAYQGIFRNPLADPYLLGVASGAGLAGALAIVLDAPLSTGGFSLLPLISFGGAMASVLLAYSIARVGGTTPNTTLILAGVAISSLSVSFISYILILDSRNVSQVLAWLLGSFNGSSWHDLTYVLPYAIPAGALIVLHGRVLNVLQLDESEASQLGIDVQRTKTLLLVAASLATAAAVSVVGIVGFIGLLAPHIVRLLIGPDYRRLLPVAAMVGSTLLIVADIGARTLVSPGELPVGVVTSFIGAPFFLFLLRRQRRAYF